MQRGSIETAPAPIPGTQVLSRALAILDAVGRGHSGLAEIGREVGTSRSTTHRLVMFLQHNGWVRHVQGRGFVLGARIVELGAIALQQMPLPAVARPHIETLARETGDTIHIGIREGGDVLYVDKIPGQKGLEMRSRVGHRMPLASTGVGKALMLDLDEAEWRALHALAEARAQAAELPPPGFERWDDYAANMRRYAAEDCAFDIEENEATIRCVAAPVRDAAGEIVAAVSVASTIPYMPHERMAELAPRLRQCCADISAGLGHPVRQPRRTVGKHARQ